MLPHCPNYLSPVEYAAQERARARRDRAFYRMLAVYAAAVLGLCLWSVCR